MLRSLIALDYFYFLRASIRGPFFRLGLLSHDTLSPRMLELSVFQEILLNIFRTTNLEPCTTPLTSPVKSSAFSCRKQRQVKILPVPNLVKLANVQI